MIKKCRGLLKTFIVNTLIFVFLVEVVFRIFPKLMPDFPQMILMIICDRKRYWKPRAKIFSPRDSQSLYLRFDPHWNETGHQLVADQIVKSNILTMIFQNIGL